MSTPAPLVTALPYTGTSPQITVALPTTPGTVTYELTVTDNFGVSATATCTVTVQSELLNAVLTAAPTSGVAGSDVTLTGSATSVGGTSLTYNIAQSGFVAANPATGTTSATTSTAATTTVAATPVGTIAAPTNLTVAAAASPTTVP